MMFITLLIVMMRMLNHLMLLAKERRYDDYENLLSISIEIDDE